MPPLAEPRTTLHLFYIFLYSAWQVGWTTRLISLLFFAVDPPVLPIKTKALWARKGGDAPPTAMPLTIRAAPTGTERPEDPSSEEAPLRPQVTVARRGASASRAPFGRTSPVVQPRGATAPSGVLKRTA